MLHSARKIPWLCCSEVHLEYLCVAAAGGIAELFDVQAKAERRWGG